MKDFGLDMPLSGAYEYEGMRGVETIRLLARRQWQRELSDDEAQRMYRHKSELFAQCPPAHLMEGIIELMVASLRKRLEEKSLSLEITPEATALIIDRGFDPLYGARPLRRYLQSSEETLIAKTILSGNLSAGTILVIDVRGEDLVCETVQDL
jgi:hypothetical protein